MLPTLAAIVLLVSDCNAVVNTSLSESCHVNFLEIWRTYFVLQGQLVTKLLSNYCSLLSTFTTGGLTSGVDFSISAEGGNFVFWPSPYGQLLNRIYGTMFVLAPVCVVHFTLFW